ncbi:hypothetical protein SeMB42_g04755 [Synchytrium endobioticum]|uniref:Plus3 domain-containing protein n=1 Tax=Synchytrium endobioticum TaxID=286115 RepID=A0A507DE86_9FUNG|nr:hypothetical protein SeMB42_g04755 [Synchytrium endobioticum]TPX49846.1 hypothetical protein SeLEV6574_g01233 [Synchytrium endobioticum]
MDDDDDILNLVSSGRTKRRREISDTDDSDSSSQNEHRGKRGKARQGGDDSSDGSPHRRGRARPASDDNQLDDHDHDLDDYESSSRKKSSKTKSKASSKNRSRKSSAATSRSSSKKTDVDDDDDGDFSDLDDDSDVEVMRKKISQYDDQGYGDEEDHERLHAMTEIEREAILADRLDQRQRLLERLEVKERLQQAQGIDARRSSRKLSVKHSKGLSELKSLKERKSSKFSASEGRSKRRSSAYGSEEESDHRYRDSGDESDNGERRDRRGSKSGRDRADREASPRVEVKERDSDVLLKDLRSIQIRRSDIAKWAFKDFFKDAVVGCVARLGLGADQTGTTTYRLVTIKDVVEVERTYKLEADLFVNLELQLQHGKATKNFRMQTISNDALTEDEFGRWKKTMEFENQKLMTMKEVEKKRRDIQKAREHIATHEEITQELSHKRQFNIIAPTLREKEALQRLLEDAQAHHKPEIAARYQHQLDRLDTALSSQRQGHQDKARHLDQINEANRRKNWTDVRAAELAAEKAKKVAGSDDLDPFARRRTIPSRMLGKEKSPSKSPSLPPQRSPNLPTRSGTPNPPSSNSPLSSSKLRPPSMSPLPASRIDSPSSKLLNTLHAPSAVSASSSIMMNENEEVNGGIVTPSRMLIGNGVIRQDDTMASITNPTISIPTAADDDDDSFLDSLDL